MSNTDIDVLNDVTKTLVDSRKGYEKAADIVDENFAFAAELKRRAAERDTLVSEFQARVRSMGGDPQTDGGMAGSIHRGFTEFSSMFRDDKKAAFGSIDDGEDHLADQIEDKLETDGLSPDTQALLRRAHASAKSGERFADRVEEALDS